MNANSMSFGKVAVLMGGVAAEREISLKSGAAVAKALQSSGIDAQAIDVTKVEELVEISQNFDRAFIALHGRWGEDGQVQAILQSLNMPFTGSKMAASAIAMDKLRAKWLWRGLGLPTPDFVYVSEQQPLDKETFNLDFPVIVKPVREGSSIGMRKVESFSDLVDAVAYAQEYDQEVLIEQWITGREFTVGVLNNQALPAIELKTQHDFYDFSAKYQSGDTQYICPVDLEPGLVAKIESLVLKAFQAIGAKGWGRMDLMLDEHNQIWLIELNTVPGMTDHSLVPKAAKQAGLSFEQLVVEILTTSFD